MIPSTRKPPKHLARPLEGPGLAQALGFADAEIEAFEEEHPEGMSVHEIVAAHVEHGIRLTEATFRKYVQLGLLPQSVRVGRKGKHRGSQGLYPVSALRQLEEIRRLMARGFTIEEIQRDFLFVRSDLEELRRGLDRVSEAFSAAINASEEAGNLESEELREELEAVKGEGETLLRRFEALERRLTLRARMERAVV